MANDSGPADLFDSGIKPPADVVIPPQAIRQPIAKTAEFLHRKPAAESGLKERVGNDPKFTWLNKEDSYNPYFEWYRQQLREGKDKSVAGGRGGQAAHDNKPKGPVKPADYRFSARMPNISAQDLEILKLTALYTAKNGENWLKELRTREVGNFQFDFLRVTHTFFGFFRSIVEQYRILFEEEQTVQARIEELNANIKNRFRVQDRAKQRAEYEKHIAQQKEKEEKRVEDEKKEYLSIDWQDFTVIATITFDETDDAADLPPPTSLNDLQSASLEQKAAVSLNNRIEEAAPDEQTYYNASQSTPHVVPVFHPIGAHVAPPVQPVYQVPPPPHDYRTPAQKARDEEEERALQQRQAERERAARAQAAAKSAPGAMRIRHDYVPGTAAKKANVPKAICPNCRQEIPTDELEEHIRIELLDPKWKEQREKADARYSSTINTVDVANNLKRFASMRDDIYDGATGMPISAEEQARRKRAAVSYDGVPDPAKDAARVQEMQNLNVQEQIRRIQEKNRSK